MARVTSAASGLIAAGKKAGRSSRDIAGTIRENLGIELDQRTISRHAKALAGKPTEKKRPKLKPVPLEGPEPKPYKPPAPPADFTATLDEVDALEREADTLQRLLAVDLPPRDRASLTGELRQLFGAIRKAKHAAKQAADAEDADVAWMVAKMKRHAANNAKHFADEVTEAEDEVPPSPRASGSE